MIFKMIKNKMEKLMNSVWGGLALSFCVSACCLHDCKPLSNWKQEAYR